MQQTTTFLLAAVCLFGAIYVTESKPIMVSFGTRGGPIIPRAPTTQTPISPREYREPAPVHEELNDIPNPNGPYKPLVPQQYREKFDAIARKNPLRGGEAPNGSKLPQAYADQKYNNFFVPKQLQHRAVKSHPSQGPQTFTTTTASPQKAESRGYDSAENDIDGDYYSQQNTVSVPQFGIFYIGGMKYYVPLLDRYVNYNKRYV